MSLVAVLLASLFSPSVSAGEPPLRLCARYSIWLPEGREELGPLNKFLLKDYLIDRSVPGRERMIFELPRDLTAGKRVPVVLVVRKQEGTSRELAGPAGAATCEGPWASMRCNFRFNKFGMDESDARWWLTKQYGHTSKRDGLLEIASRFSGDPIGFAKMAALDDSCAR